jgi:hypothetical protein
MLHHPRWSVPVAVLALLAGAACQDDPGLPSHPRAPLTAPAMAVIAQTGCNVHHSAFNRGLTAKGAINDELNDLGRLLIDADGVNGLACVDSASSALRDKLKATLDGDSLHYDRFLSGALVALIYAAGDRIGANGGMTPALDEQLLRVERHFRFSMEGDGCGLQTTDNCMDGQSTAASGYGWLAAYRYSRNLSATAARQATEYHVQQTFANACINKGLPSAVLCNGTPADLQSGAATTLAFNIGHESIPYGFGLMTSIATAVLGYNASGASYPFQDSDRIIARALFEEAQRAVTATAPFAFRTDCPRVSNVNGLWTVNSRDANCGEGTYTATMYGLYDFYLAAFGGIPSAGAYQSRLAERSQFSLGTGTNDFIGWGRWATYAQLGQDWWKTSRPNRPRTDAHAPIGYLEQVTSNRSALGWACDRDAPEGFVRVELRAPGRTPIMVRATQTSEDAIRTQCGGGGAHRFGVVLPTTWAGLAVTATAIDYLGARTTQLPCLYGCYVPQPPTVSVAWVQPSGVTWGPPNTLTAAGFAGNGTGTVQLMWRDVSVNGAWNTVSYQAPVQPDETWSNTIPVSNYCHDYQVKAVYAGITSSTFTYRGLTSGFCPERVRIIWIQPQTTSGWGTPGALIVAGDASGAPAGTTVSMWYRNVTLNGAWTLKNFSAPVDANGIWINDIPNANFSHVYAVYVKYDVTTSATCTYSGNGANNWC